MKRALAVWLIASLIGVALITFLPEGLFGDRVLFRLSDRHGPGLADGLGLAFILGGWLFYLHALWSRRRTMAPLWAVLGLVALALAGGLGCILAITSNQEIVAACLGAAALAAQIALGFTARATTDRESGA